MLARSLQEPADATFQHEITGGSELVSQRPRSYGDGGPYGCAADIRFR